MTAHQAPNQDALHLDERVEWLLERVKERVEGVPHRYQVIRVRRGDYLLDFVEDLGPEFLFAGASQINFYAGGLYSVGECIEQAHYLREGRPEQEEPSDLMGGYLRMKDEERQQRAHRSVVGPHVRIERR